MRTHLLAISLLTACAGSSKPATTPAAPAAPTSAAAPHGLQIQLTSIFVDDQDKALKFYTDVIGFQKKDDVTNNGYRWLTVTSPSNPNGGQLQLAAAMMPEAKAYQAAVFKAHAPATMLYTDDVKADAARIEAKGIKLAMPPTDIGYAIIAQVDDTCGNLIQLTQLH